MGPAGIWATCNIGASRPEDFGLYFAWGATVGYASWEDNPGGFSQEAAPYYSSKSGTTVVWSKYVSNASRRIYDGLYMLQPEDDAAHILMGGDWRMPTESECSRLGTLGYCTETLTVFNGVFGLLYTYKEDATQQLFFPFTGYIDNRGLATSDTHYWSSSLYYNNIDNAKTFRFTETTKGTTAYSTPRNYGCPIRAILSVSE